MLEAVEKVVESGVECADLVGVTYTQHGPRNITSSIRPGSVTRIQSRTRVRSKPVLPDGRITSNPALQSQPCDHGPAGQRFGFRC